MKYPCCCLNRQDEGQLTLCLCLCDWRVLKGVSFVDLNHSLHITFIQTAWIGFGRALNLNRMLVVCEACPMMMHLVDDACLYDG